MVTILALEVSSFQGEVAEEEHLAQTGQAMVVEEVDRKVMEVVVEPEANYQVDLQSQEMTRLQHRRPERSEAHTYCIHGCDKQQILCHVMTYEYND